MDEVCVCVCVCVTSGNGYIVTNPHLPWPNSTIKATTVTTSPVVMTTAAILFVLPQSGALTLSRESNQTSKTLELQGAGDDPTKPRFTLQYP